MSSTQEIAGAVASADQVLVSVLPMILGFIPQTAPFSGLIVKGLQAVGTAASVVAASKPDATPEEIFQEVINHLTAGAPNSPALS